MSEAINDKGKMNMKRDIDLCRNILLDIEENQKAGELYSPNEKMCELYGKKDNDFFNILYEHMELLEESGCFTKVSSTLTEVFVFGLTSEAYDFINKIRKDKDWKRLKKQLTKNKIPRDYSKFAGLLGNFVGGAISQLIQGVTN